MSNKITTTTPPVEKYNNKEQGWHRNTELCVNLKTLLQQDRRAKSGKNYVGTLRRDVVCEDFNFEERFIFVEAVERKYRRNPYVFRGRYFSITRKDSGTLKLNFRPLNIKEGFSIDGFVTGVANELLWALEGLVGKE